MDQASLLLSKQLRGECFTDVSGHACAEHSIEHSLLFEAAPFHTGRFDNRVAHSGVLHDAALRLLTRLCASAAQYGAWRPLHQLV